MFSPINFLIALIREKTTESPRAYIPFHLAVKSSQPRDIVVQSYNYFSIKKCFAMIFVFFRQHKSSCAMSECMGLLHKMGYIAS